VDGHRRRVQIVAIVPVIMYRLLDGPLGERLGRYVGSALGSTGVPPRTPA